MTDDRPRLLPRPRIRYRRADTRKGHIEVTRFAEFYEGRPIEQETIRFAKKRGRDAYRILIKHHPNAIHYHDCTPAELAACFGHARIPLLPTDAQDREVFPTDALERFLRSALSQRSLFPA